MKNEWPDGTRKKFDSEEEANAYIEQRPINHKAIEKEVPPGFREAQAIVNSYLVKDD